jgi:DNA-binding CsgD family transcriptional regulator
LVGREDELGTLVGVADALKLGSGSVVRIEGAAGTGKSTLLAELSRLAADRGVQVRTGAAIELDRDLPFGLVGRIVGADTQAAAGQRSLAALAEGGLAAVYAMADGAAELARSGPVLLGFDDAQWLDDQSMRVLPLLAGLTRELPVTIAVAWRRAELPDLHLRPLRDVEGTVTLTLSDLDRDGSALLIETIAAGASPEFIAACHRVTGGNPFLLQELVSAFVDSGRAPDGVAAESIVQLTPAAVRSEALSRLGRLSEGAAALARAVAVLGDEVLLHHAARVAKLGRDQAAFAADELIAVEMLRGEEALSFRHPLLASAVLDDLGSFTRSALYQRAAAAMADDGHLERSGALLLRAEPAGDAAAVSHLEAAAGSAIRTGDAGAAVRLLRRALSEPPPPEKRPGLLLNLARAEIASGDPSSIEHLDQALPNIDGATHRAQLLRGLARLHHARYEFPRAVRLAERALAELGEDDPLRDRVLATWLLSAGLDPEHQARATEVFERLADAAIGGSRPSEPELNASLSLYMMTKYMDPDVAAALAEEAVEGDAVVNDDGLGLAADFALHALLCAGQFRALIRCAGIAFETARDQASMMGSAAAACWRAHARLHLGDLRGAIADAEIALLPRRHGWPAHATYASAALALARLELGDVQAARDAIALAADLPIPDPPKLYFTGLIELAAGRTADARRLFEEAGDILQAIWGTDTPALVPWRSGAALAALLDGDRTDGERLSVAELELARKARVPVAIGRALRVRGLVVPGEEGVALLRQACTALADTESVLEHLRAQVDLGSALRRMGARRDARDVLRLARAKAEEIGCSALAARAAEEQAASGARPRRVPVDGVAALTPSELRIAQLAAAGATNREIAAELFLSPKTVEWHLGHVFSKLSVRKRRDLGRALADDAGG